MTKGRASVGAAALLTALLLASAAAAAGSPAPVRGPTGGPCAPPHPKCTIVKGKQVCTTPKPVPGCGGG
jgi:hypothetical protein